MVLAQFYGSFGPSGVGTKIADKDPKEDPKLLETHL